MSKAFVQIGSGDTGFGSHQGGWMLSGSLGTVSLVLNHEQRSPSVVKEAVVVSRDYQSEFGSYEVEMDQTLFPDLKEPSQHDIRSFLESVYSCEYAK